MSTLSTIRANRKRDNAWPVHVSCGEHVPMGHYYGDGLSCSQCGTVIREDSEGSVDADYAWRNYTPDDFEDDLWWDNDYPSDLLYWSDEKCAWLPATDLANHQTFS